MPLGPEYDKLIDSKFADMKNTGGRFGGSITAAQFIQRFVGKTPWAHLDIAGTGFASPSSDINKSWGSGWGVRLLDRLVAENYEVSAMGAPTFGSVLMNWMPGRAKEFWKSRNGCQVRKSLAGAAMTEILFYHLQRQPLESVLPQLLEKSLERGWRVSLWNPRRRIASRRSTRICGPIATTAFLPHGTYRESEAAMQPVLLTVHEHNPNSASVRFLIDGVGVPADAASYQRIVLLFDGEDDEAVAAARAHWTEAKAQGFEATYWQADENGRWHKKA